MFHPFDEGRVLMLAPYLRQYVIYFRLECNLRLDLVWDACKVYRKLSLDNCPYVFLRVSLRSVRREKQNMEWLVERPKYASMMH